MTIRKIGVAAIKAAVEAEANAPTPFQRIDWRLMMKRSFHFGLRAGVLLAAGLSTTLFGIAAAQETAKPLPPRATPGDYRAHAPAGSITIAADFAGHGVPTADAVYSTEDYIVVEIGIFGAPGPGLSLSYKDFSLRVNGKKGLLPAQPYESAFHSLKDPDWIPPDTEAKAGKTSINSGGGGKADPAAPPAKMPLSMQLAMERKVKMASLAEGERPLPEAGLVFFSYGGQISGLHSIELIYNGAAGKVSLPLQ